MRNIKRASKSDFEGLPRPNQEAKVHFHAELSCQINRKSYRVRRQSEKVDKHSAVRSEVLVREEAEETPLAYGADHLARGLVRIDDFEASFASQAMEKVIVLLKVKPLCNRDEESRGKAAGEQGKDFPASA